MVGWARCVCVCAGNTVSRWARGDAAQRRAQRQRGVEQVEDEAALPHAVHRHVDVVAAAGGVQPPGHVAGALGDQPLDEEEQILAGSVVRRAANRVAAHRGEGVADAARRRPRDDVLLGEHHQVGAMDRQQRLEEQRLGVLEVLVEDGVDVFGGEGHGEPGVRAPAPTGPLRSG